MDDAANDLQQRKIELLEGMREYLAGMLDSGGAANYTGADIGRCGDILDNSLAFIGAAEHGDSDTVLAAVQYAVRSLNTLNTACAGHLIETDQRGHICALLNQAAAAAGVGNGEDLTAAWREW
jgi:hypothetical protein